MSDALPCPFCGAPPERPQNSDAAGCNFHAGWLPLSEWNRRAGETHLRAQVEAMRGALEPFAKLASHLPREGMATFRVNSGLEVEIYLSDFSRAALAASQANGNQDAD
jgi:hypothetical protein